MAARVANGCTIGDSCLPASQRRAACPQHAGLLAAAGDAQLFVSWLLPDAKKHGAIAPLGRHEPGHDCA